MSLMTVMNIAGSALSAQSIRLNAVASNMANAESAASSTGSTYRARHPVFATVMNEQAFADDSALPDGGVRVAGIIESQAPLRREYQPTNPMADAQGYIHLPNVNMVEEMANMMSASRSYQTNVELANASKQMLQRTLTLGQ